MKTILIVDDEKVVRDVLSRFLKALGYGIATAENGIEGLARARAIKPDLVLVDMNMPDMDGKSLCALLRGEPATRRTPVIVLSGEGKLGTMEDAVATGANAYLVKPVDFQRLREKIAALLEEKR
ncbi:MAG: response regulator [Proteobacteria bacterium]|nr:response regulator [Pseudomonadota bacterium]